MSLHSNCISTPLLAEDFSLHFHDISFLQHFCPGTKGRLMPDFLDELEIRTIRRFIVESMGMKAFSDVGRSQVNRNHMSWFWT
jgi:hypothetical protein